MTDNYIALAHLIQALKLLKHEWKKSDEDQQDGIQIALEEWQNAQT